MLHPGAVGTGPGGSLRLRTVAHRPTPSSTVRVNSVPPGPVATDLRLGEHGVAETVAKATGVDADTARNTIIAGIGGFATGRLTTPEEVATLIGSRRGFGTREVT